MLKPAGQAFHFLSFLLLTLGTHTGDEIPVLSPQYNHVFI